MYWCVRVMGSSRMVISVSHMESLTALLTLVDTVYEAGQGVAHAATRV